jgi:chromosome partitioning protein
MARKITVAINKGGVGKTATAKNLAAGLAWNGQRVLLVDLDPQANATKGMGINPDDMKATIADLLKDADIPIQDAIAINGFGLDSYDNMKPVHIMASHPQLSETISSMNARQTGMIKSLLSEIEDNYDYIIMDTPPTESLMTANALIASDEVLIPVQVEVEALDGVTLILNAIEQIKRGLNPNLKIAGILPTMVQRGSSTSQLCLSLLEERYPEYFIADWVPRTVRFGNSSLAQLPVVFHDPSSEAATVYLKLARRFI